MARQPARTALSATMPQTVTQNTSANATLPANRMPTTTLPCQRRSSGSVSSIIGSEAQRWPFEHRAFLCGWMKGGERDHPPIALQIDDSPGERRLLLEVFRYGS